MPVIVSKFGGSSSVCYEDVERIKRIADDNPLRKIIVVSAPGVRNNPSAQDNTPKLKKEKVTDLLIKLARSTTSSYGSNAEPSFELGADSSEIFDEIMGRYKQLSKEGNVDYLSPILEDRLKNSGMGAVHEDSLKAFGEEGYARLFARETDAVFVDPKELFLVTNEYGNAKILPESEKMIRKKFSDFIKNGSGKPGDFDFSSCPLFVVPGFYGYTAKGNRATFSRGGSDLTGAYIAAALGAEAYENFTDIEGIFSANPNIVKNPSKIDEMTFNEMRDLAYSGFSVFHEEAVRPVKERRIPVHVRSTFQYPLEGTYIVSERISDSDRPILGIAYQSGFCSFDIQKFGLNEMIGVGMNLLQVFEKRKIPIEHNPSGIDDLSFVLKKKYIGRNQIGGIINDLYSVLGDDASIAFQEHLGTVVVAGKGLKGSKGISGRIQIALADADVNIKFISQGPLERCIIYGITESDHGRAVNAIYDNFLR